MDFQVLSQRLGADLGLTGLQYPLRTQSALSSYLLPNSKLILASTKTTNPTRLANPWKALMPSRDWLL